MLRLAWASKSRGQSASCPAVLLTGLTLFLLATDFIVSRAYAQDVLKFTNDCDPVQVKKAPDAAAQKLTDEKLNVDPDKSADDCLLPRLPTFLEATVQTGLTRKTLADEQFLIGSVEEAKRWYLLAKEAIDSIAALPQSDQSGVMSQLALLRRDLEYRLSLIAVGADFWGGGYLNHPSNPVKLFEELRTTYGNFSRIVREIEEYQASAKSDAIGQATLRAVYKEASAGAQSERWRAEQQSDVVSRNDQTRQFLLQRLQDNQRRQQEAALELKTVRASIASLNSQLTRTAISAAGNAVGLDPSVVAAINSDGDLKTAVTAAATSALGSATFTSTLRTLIPDTSQLFEAARFLNQVSIEAKEGQRIFSLAQSAIKEKDLEKLTTVGIALWEKLPAPQRDKISAYAKDNLDPTTVLQLYEADAVLKKEIWKRVTNIVTAQGSVDVQLNSYFSDDTPVPASRIISFVASRSSKLMEDRPATVSILSSLARDALFNSPVSGAPDRDGKLVELRKLLEDGIPGLSSQQAPPDDLVSRLAAAFDGKQLSLSLAGPGTFDIRVSNRTISFTTAELGAVVDRQLNLPSASLANPANQDPADIKSPKKWLTDVLIKAAASNGGTAAQAINDLLSEGIVRSQRLLEISQIDLKTQGTDLVKLGPSSAPRAAATVGGFLAAQSSVLNIAGAASALIPPQDTPTRIAPRTTEAASSKIEEQAAMLLVGNVVPGGAIAAAVLSTAKLMGQLNLAIEKGRELYEEDKSLVREQIHLADMIISTDAAKGLAAYEREIAAVRTSGSAASANEYLRAIFKSTSKISDSQAQARLRVPLAIFYAEQLRRRYDELNRALSLWIGAAGSPRGTIARLVEEDPQFVRFALDDDIQLYQWLIRDGEGERTDLRTLASHWRQIVALTEDVCRRVGCSADAAVLGTVKQTGPKSVSELVGRAEWSRFQQWVSNPKEESFEFNILISPKVGLVDPALRLVRVVDVSVGVKPGEALAVISPNGSHLIHPGVAYVPEANGRIIKEFYPLKRKDDLSWNESHDIDRLRLRWARTADLSPRDFEGYGLYTDWKFVISRSDVEKGVADVLVNFAYQYKQSPGAAPSDKDKLALTSTETVVRLSTAERDRSFDGGDLSLLAEARSECRQIERLKSELPSHLHSDIPAALSAAATCTQAQSN